MDDDEMREEIEELKIYEGMLEPQERQRTYGIIQVPYLEMYMEPFEHSEVVSQALFSEEVLIIYQIEEWSRIQTMVDGYRGWIRNEGAYTLQAHSPYHNPKGPVLHVTRQRAHVYREPETIYGPLMSLPFDTRLVAAGKVEAGIRWIKVFLPDGSVAYIQSGDVTTDKKVLTVDEMCRFSLTFLGNPYTWGGRASFGYDCSGFVQMLYKQMGYALERDAKYQIHWDHLEDAHVEALAPGDLIFYGSSDKLIKHVGLSLGGGTFIHTSAVTENMPYVRISSIRDAAWNGSGYYPYMCGKKFKSKVAVK